MILAVETAFDQCSVALYQEQLMDWRLCTEKRMQTQSILPMIDELLQAHQLAFSHIQTIAFSAGPGSFSGIRINTAVTQALAWANGWRVCAVPSLQAIAQEAYRQQGLTQVLVVVDAYMGEFYVGHYQLDSTRCLMQPVAADSLMPYADFERQFAQTELMLVGVGFERLTTSTSWQHQYMLPTAVAIGEIAQHMVLLGQDQSVQEITPVYLRHNAWKTLDEQKREIR